MRRRSLAHLSDLHLGATPEGESSAAALAADLERRGIDHVVVTGDVTERGRPDEMAMFDRAFARIRDRVTLVPGNHDRIGADVGVHFMHGERVAVECPPGLYLVRVDTTGAHNRSYFLSHGQLEAAQVEAVDIALARAPSDVLRVILMHHHPLPLPEETLPERVSTSLGWPHARELHLGGDLISRVRGRCDLILHGHRHIPRYRVFDGERPLIIGNAGSSTDLGSYQVYEHLGPRLVQKPRSCDARAATRSRSSGLRNLLFAMKTVAFS